MGGVSAAIVSPFQAGGRRKSVWVSFKKPFQKLHPELTIFQGTPGLACLHGPQLLDQLCTDWPQPDLASCLTPWSTPCQASPLPLRTGVPPDLRMGIGPMKLRHQLCLMLSNVQLHNTSSYWLSPLPYLMSLSLTPTSRGGAFPKKLVAHTLSSQALLFGNQSYDRAELGGMDITARMPRQCSLLAGKLYLSNQIRLLLHRKDREVSATLTCSIKGIKQSDDRE